MRVLWLLSGFVLGLGACTSQEKASEHPAPIPRANRIVFEPGDLMTSVRGMTYRARVLGDERVDDATLRDLMGRLSLVADDGKGVPFSVEIGPDTIDTSNWRELHITPDIDLASSWYNLRVDLRSSDVRPFETMVPLGEGLYGVRLHPDVVPVMRFVNFCPSGDEGMPALVILDFSEPVNFVPDAVGIQSEVPLMASVEGVECKLIQTAFDPHDGYNSHFEFGCDRGAAKGTLSLALVHELLTRSGAKAVFPGPDESARAMELSFEQSFDYTGGCRSWHMP